MLTLGVSVCLCPGCSAHLVLWHSLIKFLLKLPHLGMQSHFPLVKSMSSSTQNYLIFPLWAKVIRFLANGSWGLQPRLQKIHQLSLGLASHRYQLCFTMLGKLSNAWCLTQMRPSPIYPRNSFEPTNILYYSTNSLEFSIQKICTSYVQDDSRTL